MTHVTLHLNNLILSQFYIYVHPIIGATSVVMSTLKLGNWLFKKMSLVFSFLPGITGSTGLMNDDSNCQSFSLDSHKNGCFPFPFHLSDSRDHRLVGMDDINTGMVRMDDINTRRNSSSRHPIMQKETIPDEYICLKNSSPIMSDSREKIDDIIYQDIIKLPPKANSTRLPVYKEAIGYQESTII